MQFDRDALDVIGPVQAEVFVVTLGADGLELTGPCGAAPWLLELGDTDHPMEVVARLVRAQLGEPLLVHSTSWRRDRKAVILSFVVAVDPQRAASMERWPIRRRELARGGASHAPEAITFDQVVEHGLRHLAWLVNDDPAVGDALPRAWRSELADYVPEPFRNLD